MHQSEKLWGDLPCKQGLQGLQATYALQCCTALVSPACMLCWLPGFFLLLVYAFTRHDMHAARANTRANILPIRYTPGKYSAPSFVVLGQDAS
jgi:hypothetical protein